MIFSLGADFSQLIEQVSFAMAWTLVHSLWQAAIILAVLYLLLAIAKNNSANTRYLLGVFAFVAVIISSIYSFIFHFRAYNETVAWLLDGHLPIIADGFWSLISRYISNLSQHITVLWLTGFSLAVIQYTGAYLYCRRLTQDTDANLPESLVQLINKVQHKIQVKRMVVARLSKRISVPCVVGHLRPILLIPMAMINIDQKQMEAVLLHEFAHIRRNDYLVGLIQNLFKTAYFFNPFVKLISSVIDTERENICDDIAVEYCGSACVYGRMLQYISELQQNRGYSMSLFQRKEELLNRVKRQFQKKAIEKKSYASFIVMFSICASSMMFTTNAIGNSLYTTHFEGIVSLPQDKIVELLLGARNAFPDVAPGRRRLKTDYLVNDDRFINLPDDEKQRFISYLETELFHYFSIKDWGTALLPETPDSVREELLQLHYDSAIKSVLYHLLKGEIEFESELVSNEGLCLAKLSSYSDSSKLEWKLPLNSLRTLLKSDVASYESDRLTISYNHQQGIILGYKNTPEVQFDKLWLNRADLVARYYEWRPHDDTEVVDKIRDSSISFYQYEQSIVLEITPLLIEHVLENPDVVVGSGYAGLEVENGQWLAVYFDGANTGEKNRRFSQIYMQFGSHVKNLTQENIENQFLKNVALLDDWEKRYLLSDDEINEMAHTVELVDGVRFSDRMKKITTYDIQNELMTKVLNSDDRLAVWLSTYPWYFIRNKAILAIRHYQPSENPSEDYNAYWIKTSLSNVVRQFEDHCGEKLWLDSIRSSDIQYSFSLKNLNCKRAEPFMCHIATSFSGEDISSQCSAELP